jgi:Cu(I)/Ag(I) efflux system membrane fusion protein
MNANLRFFVGLVLGAALGGGLAIAHFSGRLAPLYRELGWDALANKTADDASKKSPDLEMADHADEGGMNMPGMNMPGMEMAGMDHSQDQRQSAAPPDHVMVTLSEARQQLIGVKTGRVEREALVMKIRAVGIVEPDQTRLARVQTRIRGWVTEAFVNYVGQEVKLKDPLLEIYSPELFSAQQEYLIALGAKPLGNPSGESNLLRASRRRLELAGVPEDEIEKLDRTRKAGDTLLLRAPIRGVVLDRNVLAGNYVEPSTELYRIADLSVVWLQAQIYEYELPHIEVGQAVSVSLLSDPTLEFEGKISFIEPIVQQQTRTINVRVEIPNRDQRLKPGMYADLKIEHQMGEGLLIPDSAVVRTGERGIAFRALDGGRFEPVEVTLGGRFGQQLEVLSGLQAGEKILTSAVFLVDSESQMRASSRGGGHHHH